MAGLYILQAQPNPPGKDSIARGRATNSQLNEEWVEFQTVGGAYNLVNDTVSHLTFAQGCTPSGEQQLWQFESVSISLGQKVRLHTGRGTALLLGDTYHVYAGREWFVWNNACGDRVTIRFNTTIVDSAGYAPRPPEGVLVRVPGTDRLEPAARYSYAR